ncbi:MAG: zinc-ribbon domain containing protein [Candidatus Omnitrophota bacterium]|nr:zinc-ribbon domain containing protein [Candidatus Omnitrophota bacterium]
MSFQDKRLICKQCSQEFIFAASEQEFYLQKNLQYEPKRCKSCRPLKKINQSAGNSNNPMQLFNVICAKCDKKAQIPFKPISGRPLYCRLCYQQIKKGTK